MIDVLTSIFTSSDWRSVLMGVTAFVVGLVAAAITSRMLKRRLKAEHELVRRLHEFYAKRAQLEHLMYIARRLEEDSDVKDLKARQYVHLVNQLTHELADAQEHLIVQALNQPSKRGRMLYLRKLAREAAQGKPRPA